MEPNTLAADTCITYFGTGALIRQRCLPYDLLPTCTSLATAQHLPTPAATLRGPLQLQGFLCCGTSECREGPGSEKRLNTNIKAFEMN